MKDTGSAPHVASHKRYFPGAELRPSPASRKNAFATATGAPFGADGEFTVPFQTQEGHQRKVTFENADVTVPILSGGKLADEDNALTFLKWGGWVQGLHTGDISKFVRAHGVYWIKLVCEDGVLKPKAKIPPPPKPEPGFPGVGDHSLPMQRAVFSFCKAKHSMHANSIF